MEINYNHHGKWSVEAVKQRYASLRIMLGGAEGFAPEPRTYTNKGGITWIYNIMDAVVDGVRLSDKACVELAIDYIDDNLMDSTTGYIRERMARALRHAQLTEHQKKQLASTFLKQLEQPSLHKEFKEYSRLFKTIGIEPYRARIEKCAKSEKHYIRRAVQRLLA
ncbi:MAG: hypothetical protein WAM94_05950 [Chromatiaceae bacterium]